MVLDEYKKIKPALQEAIRKVFLQCEEKRPGFLRDWFKAWGEGPPEGEE